jgi:sulfofructose kinase
MRIRSHQVCCGGQVATALSTCALMGLRAKYIGVTGADENGGRIREELARRGIDIADVVVRGINQFAVVMLVERDGERILLWDRAESVALRPTELPAGVLSSARVVHVDDVDQEAAIAAAGIARRAGRMVTSDLDRITPRTEELIAAVTIPILAEHVPSALTGEKDLERGMRKLRRINDGLLITTTGPDGAALLDGDRFEHVPAFQVEAVDTTGAGDVFRGAFIAAILRGESAAGAVRFANAAAAVSCTRLGAIDGVSSYEDAASLMQHAALRS